MTAMILVDSALRLLAIGQLLLIALVIGRGLAPRAIRLSAIGLLVGVCAYLTLATPIFPDKKGAVWALLQLASQATPMLLWVFAHLLFERPVNRWAAVGGLLVLFGTWIAFGLIGRDARDAGFWIGLGWRAVSLIMIVDALRIAIGERGDDLIEKRRRLRVGFVVVVGVLAAMVLVLEMIFGLRRAGAGAAIPQAVAILAATMAMGAALLQSDPDLLFDPGAAPAAPAAMFTPSEHVLKQKLDEAIANGVLRGPDLSIGVLAAHLGTPEHRLRALINRRLGYRNFSAFLNQHRIGTARTLLADPVHVDLPILTIAMDLGYGSLAPFNRAFRDATGQTPSEFRRTAILE